MPNQLFHQIALSMVPNIGPVLARNLLAYCGTAEEVFRASNRHLKSIPQIGSHVIEEITSFKAYDVVEKELRFIEDNQIHVHLFNSKDYPFRLKHVHSAPFLIYQKGETDLNARRIVAVVGTRKNSMYGKTLTEALVESLKPYNPIIVSGLAIGVDSIAHKSAVQHRLQTIGVLGNGLDRIYPSRNTTLSQKILDTQGSLLSELPTGSLPDRENFPKRNRIVAGMADVVVVVESTETGGSMITANLAFDYNRDVCTFPGRVGDINAKGCHKLIKQNKAVLIEDGNDLAQVMNWIDDKQPVAQISLPLTLSKEEQRIFEALQLHGTVHVDWLANQLRMRQHELSTYLLQMEMEMVIRSLPGNRVETV